MGPRFFSLGNASWILKKAANGVIIGVLAMNLMIPQRTIMLNDEIAVPSVHTVSHSQVYSSLIGKQSFVFDEINHY